MIFLFPMSFLISFGIKLQKYQIMLHFQHSHTELSSEFLLIQTHQDLLCMSHPLF